MIYLKADLGQLVRLFIGTSDHQLQRCCSRPAMDYLVDMLGETSLLLGGSYVEVKVVAYLPKWYLPRGFSANRCGVEWCLCILWEGIHRPSLCHACYAFGILTGQTRWVIWQSPTQNARASCVELCSGVGGWTQGSSISAHCSW